MSGAQPRTALSVTATSTRMPGQVEFLYGPSNQDVQVLITAGGFTTEIDGTTNDEGDLTVDFVPTTPGTLTVQVVQQSDPLVLASAEVEIAP
jgi:hypothetical protein